MNNTTTDTTYTARTPWGSTLDMVIRTEKPGDRDVIEEVVEGDTYLVGEMPYPTAAALTVFDIGAHIGCFTCLVADRYPNARILSIEPHPRSYDLLVKNTARYPNVTPLHGAVAYTRGNLLADGLNGTGGGFMVSGPNDRWSVGGNPEYAIIDEPVATYTVEELFERAGIERVDLAKWDCEGSEIDCLRHMEESTLDRFDDMTGEFHMIAPDDFHAFKRLWESRFTDHVVTGRPHDMDNGCCIGWFKAERIKATRKGAR